MSNTSKNLLSFLAGAATVAAASIFLRSENGQKLKKSLVSGLKNVTKKTKDQLNNEWLNDLEDSAIKGAQNIRSKMKL